MIYGEFVTYVKTLPTGTLNLALSSVQFEDACTRDFATIYTRTGRYDGMWAHNTAGVLLNERARRYGIA